MRLIDFNLIYMLLFLSQQQKIPLGDALCHAVECHNYTIVREILAHAERHKLLRGKSIPTTSFVEKNEMSGCEGKVIKKSLAAEKQFGKIKERGLILEKKTLKSEYECHVASRFACQGYQNDPTESACKCGFIAQPAAISSLNSDPEPATSYFHFHILHIRN